MVPIAFAELGRPAIFLVESNTRAEALLEPVRWFYRAVTAKPGHRVAYVPAQEILPYENRSPHAEISEARAVSLWRFATGEADVLIAPIQAALWRMRDPDFYRRLARTIERDENDPACGTAQFSRRRGLRKAGHLRDARPIFRPRRHHRRFFSRGASARPHRAFRRHHRVHSGFRPEHAALHESRWNAPRSSRSPNFPIPPKSCSAPAARSASGREDDAIERGFYPGWEFREILRRRAQVRFVRPVGRSRFLCWTSLRRSSPRWRNIASALPRVSKKWRTRLPSRPSATFSAKRNGRSPCSLFPRLSLEHLELSREGDSTLLRALRTQPTTRYHGNVAAFMAEVKGRLAAGEQVMVSAASTGELERFADICHEYELPYRLGELEENVTVTRLAEESSGGTTPAMVLVKAPLSEGVVFADARLALFGNSDLFETLAPGGAASPCPAQDSQFLQRSFRSQARRLRGSRRSRHRPV